MDEADMTDLVLLREAFKGSAEKRGVHLTYLPFIIKAVVPALKEFPYVNSTLDEQAGNVVLKSTTTSESPLTRSRAWWSRW